MASRGVTRMSHDDKGKDKQTMMQMHHRNTQWIYWALLILGIWLILMPATFDYSHGIVNLPGTRTIAFTEQQRITIFRFNDIICGLLLVIFSWKSLKPCHPLSLWLACGVGIWLNAAPLIFWAPSAFIYLSETFIGTLIIFLTIIIPGMPQMMKYMQPGPELPPGWTYNPSSWAQRSILIFLGFAGWMISRYLTAFQFGFIDQVWEPFFGEGSRKVLTSAMSESLPISDGGLGAFAYTFEFIMGWMGSEYRWRSMPWMVLLFGILVIPLGLVHIFLVISQPITVGHWCTLCLLAAAVMLPMIPLEIDEVIAMLQFMVKVSREGKSLWNTFWKGGSIAADMEKKDMRKIDISEFPVKPAKMIKASIIGISYPWNLIASAVIGIWLMFSPALFGTSGIIKNIYIISGAAILTIAVVSMAEVVRNLRFLNILFGLLLITLLFIPSGYLSMINAVFFGGLIIFLSLFKGTLKETYGFWK